MRCLSHWAVTKTFAMCVGVRQVHEALPRRPRSREENKAAAANALLHFNVMVEQGVAPDAVMYTHLISCMGRAQYEWQAFKFFARMLEEGIRPLPETYHALKLSTSRKRSKLLQDIEAKIHDSVAELPEMLADALEQSEHSAKTSAEAKFRAIMAGERLPSSSTSGMPSTPSKKQEASSERGTMHIANPAAAWSIHKKQLEDVSKLHMRVTEDQAAVLRPQLERLHEEELRIFLSIHRLQRSGGKAEMVARILRELPAKTLMAMMERRAYYFRSVQLVLEEQMRELERDGGSLDPNRAGEAGEAAPLQSTDAASEEWGAAQAPTPLEQFQNQPDHLYTPWGLIKKPPVAPPGTATHKNAARDNPLSRDELLVVYEAGKAMADNPQALYDVPEELLRRYARQFDIPWKRKDNDLVPNVQWHVVTARPHLLADATDGRTDTVPSAPLPRYDDVPETAALSAADVYNVVSQRCENIMVVDSKATNAEVKRLRWQRLKEKRANDDRERAAAVKEWQQSAEAKSAEASEAIRAGRGGSGKAQERPDAASVLGRSQPTFSVLGVQGLSATEPAVPTRGAEIPPWEVESGFDATTGTVRRDAVHVTETARGKFRSVDAPSEGPAYVDARMLPQAQREQLEEALRGRDADADSTPAGKRAVMRSKLADTKAKRTEAPRRRAASEESTLDGVSDLTPQERRMGRWYDFLEKCKHKREKLREEAPQPLPPRQHMAGVLQRGGKPMPRRQPRRSGGPEAQSGQRKPEPSVEPRKTFF